MRLSIYPLFLLIITSPSFCGAHDFWIEPDQLQISKSKQVNVTLREGVGLKGNTLPYITEWFFDFSLTDSEGKHPVQSELGNDPAVTFTPKPGTTLIGYQSNRDFVSLQIDKFTKYLQEEGMEYILPQLKARGETYTQAKEYYVRCAKTLVQNGALTNDDIYRVRLGYTLEIVPEVNPNGLKAGEELAMQLFYEGVPIEGVRIRAFTKDQPTITIDNRTDSKGRVKFILPSRALWLIKAVHMVPVKNDPKADWQSYWASLLFANKQNAQ